MWKFKLPLFFAVILLSTDFQITSSVAAQNQSIFESLGLRWPVKSAKTSGGFSTGLKPPIFVDATTGTVVAPPPKPIKRPLTPTGTGTTEKSPTPGKTGSTSSQGINTGGGAGAATDPASGITGGAVTIGASGASGERGL